MDSTDTTTSEEMKRSVTKVEAMEEEIKNLKLKIIELTQELEKMEERENNCVCHERQEEQVNLRKRARRPGSSGTDLTTRNEETPVTVHTLQIEGTPEKSRMSGSVKSMSSSVDSQLDEVQVKEEHVDEFIQENLHTETPSMEVDGEIDIKEEDVGYGQSVVPLNTDQSSDTPVKHEIDRSIQRMFLTPDKVSNIESVSGHFGPEVGTDSEHNRSSSSHLTKELICPKLLKPLPQVTRTGLRGRKRQLHLTTRPAVKIQCKNCSSAFDTRYKLMKHNEFGKCKAPFNCFNCGKSFETIRVFTIHLNAHTGKKKKQSTSVRIDKELRADRKRSLTLKNKKGKSDRPEKLRKVDCETEGWKEEEIPRARDGIDPPFVVERNPLKIGEILGIILSNLGKHDMLNARLVSHAWNNESLKVLRKSKFTQTLRDWKMEQYIRFAELKELHQSILPFHLDFNISSSSVYFARYNRILTSHVNSLCKIFGPQCVSTLTLTTFRTDWTDENIKEIGLIECLALVSPGLKTLDLTSVSVKIDFLGNQKISFPKLKKLICNTSNCRSGRSGPGLAYISIIENSPNLEDLTLTDPCDLDSWPLKFNQLKSLCLDELLEPKNILDKILSSSGPLVLRDLSFGFDSGESRRLEDKTIVHNILESVSSTLKSLTFHGYCVPVNTGILRLPKLPELEHLGLEYFMGNTRRQDPETINISPENFKSVKSIELPIGFIFRPSPDQSEDNDNVIIEFPNFTKLILRVNAKVGPERVVKPLKHLQQIFPTPAKLCLVNIGGDDFVTYVLYQIMKSKKWSKNIQQIEMIKLRPSNLGGILNLYELSQAPRVDSVKWYERLEETLKSDFQCTMNRIGIEFKETVHADSIILKRAN